MDDNKEDLASLYEENTVGGMDDAEPKYDSEASRGDYWEVSVYRYLSRLHKDAQTSEQTRKSPG